MAGVVSTKDLSKVINSFITTPILPLPDDLSEVIEAYLDKYDKYDEASSDRLHDELLSIYQKNVHEQPRKYAPFLAVLRRLKPAVRNPARLFQWWDKLVEPVLSHLDEEQGLAQQALGIVLDILTGDEDESDEGSGQGTPNLFARRMLEIWLQEFQATQAEGRSAGKVKEKQIRDTLLLFGKKRPKNFLVGLDSFLVRRGYRSRALTLLCEFLQSQPPHVYLVLQTPLFGNLLQCLQSDTSTTVVSLALTAVIMFLPHMPGSLVTHLPSLFTIYARLLFWERERAALLEVPEADSDNESLPPGPVWDKCRYSPDVEGATITHLLSYFTVLYGLYPINFTDFIRKPQRYLRHANAPNADEIEIQASEIRQKSERFRQCHLLHPNFYSLTIDSEKTDFDRWSKSEPADVVAECMALCSESGPGAEYNLHDLALQRSDGVLYSDEPSQDGGPDPALLSGSVVVGTPHLTEQPPDNWRYTQSTAVDSPTGSRIHSTVIRHSSVSSHPSVSNRDSLETRSRDTGADSPTLPPHIMRSGSHTQLQDMIHSNKVIKSGLHQSLANDSVPSLSLSYHESIPDRGPAKHQSTIPQAVGSPMRSPDTSVQVAQMYRELLIQRNDLNFERYMKQQHMTHIGELRRRQVREAATEAEMQNLIMNNRNLKNRLEEAKKSETQVKKESEKIRTLSKKWEADLSMKLKNLREEQKKWNLEGATLRSDLEACRDECAKLTRMVCEYEVKDLNAKQNIQSKDLDIDEIERLKAEVGRLKAVERDAQAEQVRHEAAIQAAAEADGRTECLSLKIAALEHELRQTKDLYESQIVVLNTKLQDALKNARRQRQSTDAQTVFESALTASRAKQAELQKQYSLLMRKYTVLQSSLLDMTCASGPPPRSSDADAAVSAIVGSPPGGGGGGSGGGGGGGSGGGGSASSGGGGGGSARAAIETTRVHRGFSDPEAGNVSVVEGIAYNVTPPLDTHFATLEKRPSTPMTPGPGSAGGAGNVSPQTERYFGRGGVQNAIRKERKDKKSESDKKEKKFWPSRH